MKYLLVPVLALAFLVAVPADAKEPFKQNGKEYYVVTSTDPAKDTGTEVCAALGKQCVGYTNFDNKACKYFHPTATETSGVNGSKNGFYCDGSPQSGICATSANTCAVCPNCNVNATCDTQIGDQYREMYVECSGGTVKATFNFGQLWANWWSGPSNWWQGVRSSFSAWWSRFGTAKLVKQATIQVQGPGGTESVNIPEDSYVCEFYQTNKKLATCAAIGGADSFCVTAMGSRHARAALCQENGLIVCNAPCTTNPKEIIPTRCAFDNDRPRGNQAAPLNFCTATVKVDMGGLGTNLKKAGQVCQHGGECGTGICLGQPSDQGIKYFCSCKQNVHDYTCGK